MGIEQVTRNATAWSITALLLTFLPVAAAACPIVESPQNTIIPSERYEIALSTEPADIKVGDLFVVRLDICRKDGTGFDGDVSARATMPAHKHGMNYKPELVSAENGRFILEGFAFHMQGRWQFEFDLADNGETSTVLLDYILK